MWRLGDELTGIPRSRLPECAPTIYNVPRRALGSASPTLKSVPLVTPDHTDFLPHGLPHAEIGQKGTLSQRRVGTACVAPTPDGTGSAEKVGRSAGLKQADFEAAVRALHAEHRITVLALLQNSRLRSEELRQAFSLVKTPDTEEWVRLEAVKNVLRNRSVTLPIFATITAEDWRHIAETAPDLIGMLWSAFATEERHWRRLFAVLASTPFQFLEHCSYFAERLSRWSPSARALAAPLLVALSAPATAILGSTL